MSLMSDIGKMMMLSCDPVFAGSRRIFLFAMYMYLLSNDYHLLMWDVYIEAVRFIFLDLWSEK